MKKMLTLLCLVPSLALAGSVFDGTWKTKPDTIRLIGPPDAYEISQGMYHCTSCVPPIEVKADGTDQSVSGHDYYDTLAVKVVNQHTVVETRKKAGKVMNKLTDTVSADGKKLTVHWMDYTGVKVATGTGTSKRVSAGPTGSHALSGTWQQDTMMAASDTALTVKFKATADGLQNEWNGQTYDAKFDGKEYPVMNDPGKTTVSLKRIDANTVEETDRRGGKITDVYVDKVSADGKSMSVVDTDPVHKTKTTYTMMKQP